VLFFVSPTVLELTPDRVVIKIPLRRRTMNHVHSMYFAVLSAGADAAAGFIPMKLAMESPEYVSLVFKDFKAEFLKRAEGDVIFTCSQGRELGELVRSTIKSGKRVEMPVNVVATVPERFGSEPVARFTLTISMRRK